MTSALLALSLVMSGPAEATEAPKVYTAIPVSDVAAIIRAEGHIVEQRTDSAGDPLLVAKAGDLSYQVVFYDCTDDACVDLQFRAWWKVSESALKDLEATAGSQQTRKTARARRQRKASDQGDASWVLFEPVNAFNQEIRTGRAYLDSDGDPCFEVVMTAEGGVTLANVEANHSNFMKLAPTFAEGITP